MQLPRILLVIWIVLGIFCALYAAFWARAAGPDRYFVGRVVLFGGILLALATGILFLGYLVPMTISVAALLWCLGERQMLRFGLTLLLLGPGIWLLFHHVLGLRLPVLMSGGLF